jgi:hypothetical protein
LIPPAQVEDCDLASFHVHAGDIIVMGSDGLLDNLAEVDIMTEVGGGPFDQSLCPRCVYPRKVVTMPCPGIPVSLVQWLFSLGIEADEIVVKSKMHRPSTVLTYALGSGLYNACFRCF